MHAPVLVAAPEITPVSLDEAKVQLAVDHTEHDALITGYINAAVDHLDGWPGILGRCLVEQTWRQNFDGFATCMRLPLAPVLSVDSIKTTDADGVEATVPDTAYSLQTDARGSFVRLNSTFSSSSSLADSAAVAVTFIAGYATTPEVPADGETPAVPAQSTVPAAIKAAIQIHVRLMYDAYRLGKEAGPIPVDAMDALLRPYRRVGV